jgi:hypothetical protein
MFEVERVLRRCLWEAAYWPVLLVDENSGATDGPRGLTKRSVTVRSTSASYCYL